MSNKGLNILSQLVGWPEMPADLKVIKAKDSMEGRAWGIGGIDDKNIINRLLLGL